MFLLGESQETRAHCQDNIFLASGINRARGFLFC